MSTMAYDPSAYMTRAPDPATQGYVMQQTMIRVKDPEASLKFYCEGLGMNLIMSPAGVLPPHLLLSGLFFLGVSLSGVSRCF